MGSTDLTKDKRNYTLGPPTDVLTRDTELEFHHVLYKWLPDDEHVIAKLVQRKFRQKYKEANKEDFAWEAFQIIAVVLDDRFESLPYRPNLENEFANVPLHLAVIQELPVIDPIRHAERPIGVVGLLDGKTGEFWGLHLHLEEARWVTLAQLHKSHKWHRMQVPPSEKGMLSRALYFGGPMLPKNIVEEQAHGGNLFVVAKSCMDDLSARPKDPWIKSTWQLRVGQVFRMRPALAPGQGTNDDGFAFLEAVNRGSGGGVLLGLRRLNYTVKGELYQVTVAYIGLKYVYLRRTNPPEGTLITASFLSCDPLL